MAGDVFGERRRDEQRGPGWVRHGGSVAVAVRLSDGSDRSPEVGREFGVPGNDRGVGQGDVELREQPGVVGHAVALLLRDGLGNLIPLTGRRDRAGTVGPEPRDLGLIDRAGRAGGFAESFDFVELRGVLGTG